jgi:L,D-transpeptidase YbiS
LKSRSLALAAIFVASTAVSLFGQEQIEGLPDEAPRTGTVITIDVSTNTLYLFANGEMMVKSPVATATGNVLRHGNRIWAFHTPRGHLRVVRKVVDPIWRKPDWAFIEDRERIPPADSPSRSIKGHLGKYALDLGEGILIHGTDDARSIGQKASHGCMRLPDKALKQVYKAAEVGTDVYVFESEPVTEALSGVHSDLDVGLRK